MIHSLDFATVVLVVTVALLLYAAFIDLKHYKISNELILLLIGLFVLYAFLSDRWTDVAWNLGLAAGVFLFLIYFYSRRWIGGGDIKILPVAFLWTGIDCAFLFVLLLLVFVILHTPAAPLCREIAPAELASQRRAQASQENSGDQRGSDRRGERACG